MYFSNEIKNSIQNYIIRHHTKLLIITSDMMVYNFILRKLGYLSNTIINNMVA